MDNPDVPQQGIPTCVTLELSVKEYLEDIIKDPLSKDFKKTRSHIINIALIQHAATNGRTIYLPVQKKRGRPKGEREEEKRTERTEEKRTEVPFL